MIFSPNVVKGIADDAFLQLKIMLVYSGPQPGVSGYVDGFLSNYGWNSSSLLQGFLGIGLDGSEPYYGKYKIIKNSQSGESYIGFSKQAGIAKWAAIIDYSLAGNLLRFNTETQTIEFLRNISENDMFAIVPVSDMNGSGVLKFNSAYFVHPDISGSDDVENFVLNFIGQ